VSAATAYAKLRELGAPTLTTAEAAAALRVSTSSASRALHTLAQRGLAAPVRHGLWTLLPGAEDPRRLAPEITRPYPAYVSFASALAARGVIDQIPREIALASTGRPKRVRTRQATFVVHRVPATLFGGFEDRDGVPLATAEKALFDFQYVTAASGKTRERLPELDLPASFSRREVDRWVGRIPSPRLRRLVADRVERALAHAEYEDGPGAVDPGSVSRSHLPRGHHPSR
jgi:predicted transcriptional regulator of viral defense system